MTLLPASRPEPSERAAVSRGEAERCVRQLLRYVGEDPDREGLVDTPKRFIKAWDDLFSGYAKEPKKALERTFEEVEGYDEVVVLRDTQFFSHCEHHVIPMKGTVDIGYLPNGRVVGLSKLSRLVDGYARRMQTQEALTAQIANAIEEVLQPRGLAVIVRASHQCMAMRGVEQGAAETVTQSLRGVFRTDPAEEARLFRLLER